MNTFRMSQLDTQVIKAIISGMVITTQAAGKTYYLLYLIQVSDWLTGSFKRNGKDLLVLTHVMAVYLSR